jgi:hypothetical protein
MIRSLLIHLLLTLSLIAGSLNSVLAQGLLKKSVSLSVTNTPVSEVLKSIGRQGGFSFSYSSKAIAGKRLVSINVRGVTVAQALDELLKGTCTYKEVGNHIVLQASGEKFYQVSGYVLDAASGQGIPEASVYERQQLVAAVTNSDGYFKLRLRHQYPTADLSISKERYQDTTIYFAAVDDNRVYRLPVRQATLHHLDEFIVTDNPRGRFIDNILSRLFINNRLKAQTRNITRFIAERPVQSSFVPGIGTHGKLGAQVVNKFSLNVLGGYTAGVNGVEVGGLFNINRGNVGYVQVAGLFNVVGGGVQGVQVGGLSNTVHDSVSGVQVAGLSNFAGSEVKGVQVGGISNVAADTVDGVQVGGVANVSRRSVHGAQVAGVANISREVKGIQISGVVNFTKELHGMQIGLINLADSSDGTSLGLINISRNGYHKLAFYADEIVPLNTALKTGTSGIYTILFAGYNPGVRDKVFSFGAGLGHQSRFSRHWSLTTEATAQHLYLGDWDHARFLYRLRPSLCYQPVSWLSFYTGPSLNVYQSNGVPSAIDYLKTPASKGFGSFTFDRDFTGWIGWQAGLAFF